MICPHCGKEHKEGISFCPVTGAKLDMQFTCMTCGSELESDWIVCAQCGTPIKKDVQKGTLVTLSAKRRKSSIIAGVLIFFMLFIAAGTYLALNTFFPKDASPAAISNPSSPNPPDDTFPTVTLAESSLPDNGTDPDIIPILDAFIFSTTPIPYPEDWPEEIRYPISMILVHARGSSEGGWISQHLFQGPVQDASTIIEAFFIDKGWVLNEKVEVDKNNRGLFITRNNHEGLILISWDPNINQTKIAITVYD
jgi:hypothetical protein